MIGGYVFIDLEDGTRVPVRLNSDGTIPPVTVRATDEFADGQKSQKIVGRFANSETEIFYDLDNPNQRAHQETMHRIAIARRKYGSRFVSYLAGSSGRLD